MRKLELLRLNHAWISLSPPAEESPAPCPGCTVAYVRSMDALVLLMLAGMNPSSVLFQAMLAERPKDCMVHGARSWVWQLIPGTVFRGEVGRPFAPCQCRAASHPTWPTLPLSLVSSRLGGWRVEEMR